MKFLTGIVALIIAVGAIQAAFADPPPLTQQQMLIMRKASAPGGKARQALFECVEKKALFLADAGEEQKRIPMMAFAICEEKELHEYLWAIDAEGNPELKQKVMKNLWPELESKIKKLVQERRSKKYSFRKERF